MKPHKRRDREFDPEHYRLLEPYVYLATVVDVYDGDTIRADIDLGFGICLRDQIFRLHGIDAPELRGSERDAGLVTRDWLRDRILNKQVKIITFKDKKGKYGRWLALVQIDNVVVNDEMITLGLAEIYT